MRPGWKGYKIEDYSAPQDGYICCKMFYLVKDGHFFVFKGSSIQGNTHKEIAITIGARLMPEASVEELQLFLPPTMMGY